ncbi:hypothetical protein GCM10011581_17520 [Saccharopolyspora subtropica]|uniref:Uncharacterized protein n=1 Tax=Saccharopolyspora thermophila TaxID=89367 RepID=A0A917N9I2_9PSEU|nr:hypothetical protein GCM10011581_17520 [Saccharopolyspora subtropica]
MPAGGADHTSTRQCEAIATREGNFPDVGTTQGRSAAEAREMAKDLVTAMLDVPLESVEVPVTLKLLTSFATKSTLPVRRHVKWLWLRKRLRPSLGGPWLT